MACTTRMWPSMLHCLWPCLPPSGGRLILPVLRSLRTPTWLWFGPDSRKWPGPFSNRSTPDYLTGRLPGVKGGGHCCVYQPHDFFDNVDDPRAPVVSPG